MPARQKIFFTLSVAVVLSLATFAAFAATKLTPKPGSSVSLAGDSTLHPFTASTSKLEMTAEVVPPANSNDLLKAITHGGALKRLELTIFVDSLKSDKEALDKNMYKALNAAKCPTIEFRMARYEVGASSGPSWPVRAEGTLRVACKEQPVALAAELQSAEGVFNVKGRYPLQMTDYGVTPPKMMMGTIKVKNDVTVSWDLRLSAELTP